MGQKNFSIFSKQKKYINYILSIYFTKNKIPVLFIYFFTVKQKTKINLKNQQTKQNPLPRAVSNHHKNFSLLTLTFTFIRCIRKNITCLVHFIRINFSGIGQIHIYISSFVNIENGSNEKKIFTIAQNKTTAVKRNELRKSIVLNKFLRLLTENKITVIK